jgi:hypothetical protein
VTLGTLGLWMLWKADTRDFSKSLQVRMSHFSEQAVELARKEFAIELNYDVESLPRLEIILDQFHKRHQELPIPEKELSQLVLTWGSYLGIVLQKKYGGSWEKDSLLAGKNTFPLRFATTEAIPVIWCLRRIRKGAAANFLATIHKFENSLITSNEPIHGT